MQQESLTETWENSCKNLGKKKRFLQKLEKKWSCKTSEKKSDFSKNVLKSQNLGKTLPTAFWRYMRWQGKSINTCYTPSSRGPTHSTHAHTYNHWTHKRYPTPPYIRCGHRFETGLLQVTWGVKKNGQNHGKSHTWFVTRGCPFRGDRAKTQKKL